ncbi:MAG: hypothetical protein M3P26_10200, partial [Gemmatimonadota bacterium]|nr:hypothetical protein [Gemmatimonadota bacterium]
VQPDDIAAELRGLFLTGFDVDSIPTEAQVIEWISTADDIVRLHLVDITGGTPAVTDAAARLAKTYIRAWVVAQVLRVVYSGQDSLAVDQASRPYSDTAKLVLKELDTMGLQAIGTGEASALVAVAYTLPDRELAVTDDELDMDNTYRTRKY